MQYREFGKTGVKISALGFGCMRLPMIEKDGSKVMDQEKIDKMLMTAYEKGVNYFDTAYGYCDGLSEIAVGKALKSVREKVMISTKSPLWHIKAEGDFMRLFEEQLKKLDTDYIDFYHLHGLSLSDYNDKIKNFKIIEKALKLKEEGRIRHLSFSSHDKPENIKQLIDTGFFETILCQYNLLDRANEEVISYAREKGVGVVVMGPVAGGRLAGVSKDFTDKIGMNAKSNADMAMRFVLNHQGVSCALSGMGNIDMVTENIEVASNAKPLSAEETKRIDEITTQCKELANLYCTGCKYCMPCPKEVNISRIFELMNYYKVYGNKEYAVQNYGKLAEKDASACVECGICETKCPQNIKIRKQLKETHSALYAG